jgi:hypothetical protein
LWFWITDHCKKARAAIGSARFLFLCEYLIQPAEVFFENILPVVFNLPDVGILQSEEEGIHPIPGGGIFVRSLVSAVAFQEFR